MNRHLGFHFESSQGDLALSDSSSQDLIFVSSDDNFTDDEILLEEVTSIEPTLRINYDSLKLSDICQNFIEIAKSLKPILLLSTSEILLLLQQCQWNDRKLMDDWTQNDDLLLEVTGLKISDKFAIQRGRSKRINFDCAICCENEDTEIYELECGHAYCLSCYQTYINNKLDIGDVIKCMDCNIALKPDDLNAIIEGYSSLKYIESSVKSFILKNGDIYKYCPYTNCQNIIRLNDPIDMTEYTAKMESPVVVCSDSHEFCFECGVEVHKPSDCTVTKKWIEKIKAESENMEWVLSNTKECPKCFTVIEKDGGCNHMSCPSCSYEFCWMCENDWKPHKTNYYDCTFTKITKNTSSLVGSEKQKHFSYYYRMFSESELSSLLDWQLGNQLNAKIQELQKKIGISWIDGQFLTDDLKILSKGRLRLKWSYPLIFYSDSDDNFTKIYTDNQKFLAESIETLSSLLQIKDPTEIIAKKSEFQSKANFVSNRTDALLKCGDEIFARKLYRPESD